MKLRKFILIFVAMTLAGFFVRIYQHNLRIRTLYSLQEVEGHADQLKTKVEDLRVEIATLHYTTLEDRATQLGFSNASKHSTVVTP